MSKIFTIFDENEYFERKAFSSKEKLREYVNKAIADDPDAFVYDAEELPTCEQLEDCQDIIIDEFEFDPEFKSHLA